MSLYQVGLQTASQKRFPFVQSRYHQGLVVSGDGIGGTGILADLDEEWKSIQTDMIRFSGEIANQLAAIANEGGSPSDEQKQYLTSLQAFYAEWNQFKDDHQKWWKAITEAFSIYLARETWKSMQDFRARLVRERKLAENVGFSFVGPAPREPRENVFEETFDTVTSPFRQLWNLLKFALYIGLFIGGIWLLHSFWVRR